MKWLEKVKTKLKTIFRKNMQIPRKNGNKSELDFSEINHFLIFQDDNGIPKCIVACGGNNNENFYFEEYSADLMQSLGHAHGDCKYVFSKINDSLKNGENLEHVLSSIKNLLK
ncbi:MAG: hypothetical protein V4807_30820 [Burkholderia gladioli]